jgi:2'-hydroxyisoflavone reductase
VPGADESAPLATVEDPESKAVTGETYGALKACCEREAAKAFGERCTNLRPGLIVGPGDPTDRFSYWPVRVARGGKVLLPAPKSARGTQVTFVDVRDCAAFAVKCVADGHGGTFNVSGPAGPLTFREMVDACKACTSAPVEFVPVDEKFLLEEGVAPWMGLPLWLPEDPEYAGAGSVSRARALAAGCTFRPLADTVQATLAWWARERGDAFPFGAKPGAPGLPAARERELIEAWEARA